MATLATDILTRIIDDVVTSAENECCEMVLGGVKMQVAQEHSGFRYRSRKAPYKRLDRRIKKVQKAKQVRAGKCLLSVAHRHM